MVTVPPVEVRLRAPERELRLDTPLPVPVEVIVTAPVHDPDTNGLQLVLVPGVIELTPPLEPFEAVSTWPAAFNVIFGLV
jgi:hypothetical protein